MTTLDERAAGALDLGRLLGVEDGAEPEVDEVDDVALPALDFMRGYLAAFPEPDRIDATMRGWLVGLIDEAEHTRAALALKPLAKVRSGQLDTGYGLSPTELRVYRYLRNTAMNQREIAGTMFVTINTVKTHCKNIYAKCEIARRAELRNLPNL